MIEALQSLAIEIRIGVRIFIGGMIMIKIKRTKLCNFGFLEWNFEFDITFNNESYSILDYIGWWTPI